MEESIEESESNSSSRTPSTPPSSSSHESRCNDEEFTLGGKKPKGVRKGRKSDSEDDKSPEEDA